MNPNFHSRKHAVAGNSAARRSALARLAAAAAWPALALPAACSGRVAAPEVSYTLLDGRAASISSLRGRVVLVNFWATSCTTCVAEMPGLVDTYQRFKGRGYDTLAVAMSYDPPAYVQHFTQTRALPFSVVLDNTGALAKAFGDVSLTPTTFLLDKKGGVVKRYVGAPKFDELHIVLERLLAEPA